MPTHHLSEETLLAYASAALPARAAVVVAAHLQMCLHCRHALYFMDGLGGTLLARPSQASPDHAMTALPDGAMRAMRVRIDSDTATLSDAPVVAAGEVNPDRAAALPDVDPDILPHALWPAFGRRYSELVWTQIEPGVEQIAAHGHAAEAFRLMRIRSEADLPAHAHTGNELTLVLKGSYRDDLGHFASGDLADLDESVTHAPRADPGEACIAVVTHFTV